jgi:hypothetical protein
LKPIPSIMWGDQYPLGSLCLGKINQSVHTNFSAYCVLRIKTSSIVGKAC